MLNSVQEASILQAAMNLYIACCQEHKAMTTEENLKTRYACVNIAVAMAEEIRSIHDLTADEVSLPEDSPFISVRTTQKEERKELCFKAWVKAHGVKKHAAKLVGLSYKGFCNQVKDYTLDRVTNVVQKKTKAAGV